MREIKVRGYAVEEMVGKQWMYGTGIYKRAFTVLYAKETGRRQECFVFTESGWIEVHDESVGQYTGLKDKNGKEIYEGDVLNSVSAMQREAGYVSFNDGAFCLSIIFSRTTQAGTKYFLSTCKELEVIGNIYENPSLLEVQK